MDFWDSEFFSLRFVVALFLHNKFKAFLVLDRSLLVHRGRRRRRLYENRRGEFDFILIYLAGSGALLSTESFSEVRLWIHVARSSQLFQFKLRLHHELIDRHLGLREDFPIAVHEELVVAGTIG